MPNIISHPPNREVVLDSRITLSVLVTGDGNLAYQWFHNGSFVTDNVELGFGSTTDTLVIFSAQFSDAGVYTVLISNTFQMVESLPGVVTVGEHNNYYLLGFAIHSSIKRRKFKCIDGIAALSAVSQLLSSQKFYQKA